MFLEFIKQICLTNFFINHRRFKMKKKYFFLGMLALALTFGIVVTGCDHGDSNNTIPESVTYSSMDSSSTTYTLTVTDNTGRAAYAGKVGDTYELKIKRQSGTAKMSRGAVQAIESSSGSMTLKPSNTTTTFSVTASATSMTAISGTITLEDGTTEEAPTEILMPSVGNNPFAGTSWAGTVNSVAETLTFTETTYTQTFIESDENEHSMVGTYTRDESVNTEATLYIDGEPEAIVAISGNTLTLYTTEDYPNGVLGSITRQAP
jgi:hypothetical protein